MIRYHTESRASPRGHSASSRAVMTQGLARGVPLYLAFLPFAGCFSHQLNAARDTTWAGGTAGSVSCTSVEWRRYMKGYCECPSGKILSPDSSLPSFGPLLVPSGNARWQAADLETCRATAGVR